jgi:hypothetical protein
MCGIRLTDLAENRNDSTLSEFRIYQTASYRPLPEAVGIRTLRGCHPIPTVAAPLLFTYIRSV